MPGLCYILVVVWQSLQAIVLCYRMLIIHVSPACVLINVFLLVYSSNIFSSNTAKSANTGIIIELL